MLRKLISLSFGLAFLLTFVPFAGCNRYKKNSIEMVLEMAGSNRQNLENVLRHFENDSAGLAAAEFLIRNMPMHVSYRDTVGLGHLNAVVDSCLIANRSTDCYAIREILDPLISPVSNFSGKIIPDLQFIDDKTLIRHIETALKIWRESPWASHLDFDEFCEWLLPYKVQEIQPVDDWMNYLSPYFDTQLKTIGYCDIYKSSLSRACRMVNDCMKETIQPAVIEVSFSPDALNMKTRANIPIGRCSHYVALATAVMRSKGIPVGIDFTPIWGYRNLGHEWNVLLDKDGKAIPFDAMGSNPGDALKPDERMGKVFRHTFAPNPKIMALQKSGCFVPSTFRSPFIKDVTAEYLAGHDLKINLPRIDDAYVYLALSNRNGWTPVDFSEVKGKKACFSNVGTGNIYAILRYRPDGSHEVIGEPFLLHVDGSRQFF
ncbi:MAG: transglutaminase-like domain-containing protein, partial [Muribaculaceae bacterium]|nr:transglutaminase-like domain-containing protein [Muribaculaceae bacterium]